MKEVQRWECRVATNANGRPYVDDIEYASGRYVLHSDHEAEIARAYDDAHCKIEAIYSEEIARLRAEVEWIRSWLPAMKVLVSAVEEEFCSELTEASEPDNSKVSYPEEDCPITFGMIREARKAVDYAMGASA